MLYQLLRKLAPVIIFVILGIFVMQFARATAPADPRITSANVGVLASLTATPAGSAAPTDPGSTPIDEHLSASIHTMLPTEVAHDADVVMQGVVLGPSHSAWHTPTGARPSKQPMDLHHLIYTDTPVQVDRSLKGTLSDKVILVRTLGGQVGADRIRFSEEAELQQGQRVILFLIREDVLTGQYGPAHYKIVGVNQGMYAIAGTQATAPTDHRSLADLYALITTAQH